MFDSIEEICERYNTKYFYSDGLGYVGVWDGDTSRFVWYAVRRGKYVITGTTMGPMGATKTEIKEVKV